MASSNISTVVPTSKEKATALARMVISSYPSAQGLPGMAEYASTIVTMLQDYSGQVAQAGLDAAMAASPTFPPPTPLIRKHCDELLASTRQAFGYAAQWEEQSRKQLAERLELDRGGESLEHRRAVTERIMREYHAAVPVAAPETKPAASTFRRLTGEELMAIYGKPDEAAHE